MDFEMDIIEKRKGGRCTDLKVKGIKRCRHDVSMCIFHVFKIKFFPILK